MLTSPKVLIIGVFHNAKTRTKIPCSVPEQLTRLLEKNNVEVITTSKYLNRFGRFFDTVFTILFNFRKYDLAIVPWYNGTGSFYWQEVASRLLKLINKKTILVMHGGGIPDLIDQQPSKYLKTLRRASIVACPSQFISSRLLKHNIDSVIIENALDLSKYPFKQKQEFALNILWMRTLEPLYNPTMALEVARMLKEKRFDFSMFIAGQDNGHLHELQQLQKEYNLEKEVDFCGLINHNEKLEMARKCDMYICTNRVDNAPVSLIEMMSLGVPIVSSNVGGIPYFITDKENGFLVDDNDAETMVDKLIEIHLCPSIGRNFARNGYLFSKHFGERKIAQKWKYYIGSLRNNQPEYSINPKDNSKQHSFKTYESQLAEKVY